MQSGTLTAAGRAYSESLAEYLLYEQQTDLVAAGKEILVLTGTAK
jgi:2,4-dienoyl-CoA reductase-like NADH-dependent reductase (Old Yellow Enzyme family)